MEYSCEAVRTSSTQATFAPRQSRRRRGRRLTLIYVLACGGSGPPRGFLAANRHVFLFAVTGLCPLWVCGRRLNLRLARPRSTSLLALLLLCFFVHIATDVPGFCRLHVDGYIERKLSVACRVETNLVILCNCSCIVHLPIISSSFGNCSCTVKLPRFVTAAILLCLRLPMQRLWDVSVHETWHS